MIFLTDSYKSVPPLVFVRVIHRLYPNTKRYIWQFGFPEASVDGASEWGSFNGFGFPSAAKTSALLRL